MKITKKLKLVLLVLLVVELVACAAPAAAPAAPAATAAPASTLPPAQIAQDAQEAAKRATDASGKAAESANAAATAAKSAADAAATAPAAHQFSDTATAASSLATKAAATSAAASQSSADFAATAQVAATPGPAATKAAEFATTAEAAATVAAEAKQVAETANRDAMKVAQSARYVPDGYTTGEIAQACRTYMVNLAYGGDGFRWEFVFNFTKKGDDYLGCFRFFRGTTRLHPVNTTSQPFDGVPIICKEVASSNTTTQSTVAGQKLVGIQIEQKPIIANRANFNFEDFSIPSGFSGNRENYINSYVERSANLIKVVQSDGILISTGNQDRITQATFTGNSYIQCDDVNVMDWVNNIVLLESDMKPSNLLTPTVTYADFGIAAATGGISFTSDAKRVEPFVSYQPTCITDPNACKPSWLGAMNGQGGGTYKALYASFPTTSNPSNDDCVRDPTRVNVWNAGLTNQGSERKLYAKLWFTSTKPAGSATPQPEQECKLQVPHAAVQLWVNGGTIRIGQSVNLNDRPFKGEMYEVIFDPETNGTRPATSTQAAASLFSFAFKGQDPFTATDSSPVPAPTPIP